MAHGPHFSTAPMHVHTLVIGSGIAGLNFALHAAAQGKVLVVTKKRTATSGTNHAQGGIAAVLDKTDRIEEHVRDTMEAGSQHNVRRTVEFMVKKGPEAIARLIEFGVPFATGVEGQLLLTQEGGHRKRRIAFVGDTTGHEIEAALVEQVTRNPNITVWEYTFAADLLIKDKVCYGAEVIHRDKTIHIHADNTVLATGGIGQVYRYTTNPLISMGDGIGMAVRAGLPTKDMEFIQFHPTALKIKGNTRFLLSEALRGEGARLIDIHGKRFMKKIHHMAELAPRDVVARAVYEQDLAGGIFLDLRHLKADELKLRFPMIYQTCKKHGLDFTKTPLPISPAAHYCCGGIPTTLNGETQFKNLYAFGEVTRTGVHGANRLASNSLLEALVFSNQILKKMPQTPSPTSFPKFPLHHYQKPTPTEWAKLRALRRTLQNEMWKHAGIVRTTTGLNHLLLKIEALFKKLPTHKTVNVPHKETENMLITAREIAHAALKRTKSLGSHYREISQ